MNIKILDSWLREFVHTKATAYKIAEKLSLTSVSIERVEKHGKDFVYDIEITTNRPDLASVIGIARETSVVLPQFNIPATFKKLDLEKVVNAKNPVPLIVKNENPQVKRVLAVVLEVEVKKSPQDIQERLETSDIRSLNNVIDITNYVMRTIGHPTHVMDYDLLNGNEIKIVSSNKGDEITTLDGKTYILSGGDIVGKDTSGTIIDLLGVMGLKNSSVTDATKRIVFFVNTNNGKTIRKTSMGNAIRTEAAQLNEKELDPEMAQVAFEYGVSLFKKLANGKVISEVIDIYPHPYKEKTITVPYKKVVSLIGVPVSIQRCKEILIGLGFKTEIHKDSLQVHVPSYRSKDIEIEEDIIEEIARIYGYDNIPSILPPETNSPNFTYGEDVFYWENRIKNSLKYWGFTETYTYSFVSENLYEGPLEKSVKIKNPLTEDFVYMRKTLIPSLLQVVDQNKGFETIRIFEIAHVYEKKGNDLPKETENLALVLKSQKASFYELKGILEQLFTDCGIKKVTYKKSQKGGLGASIYIGTDYLGEIEVLDSHIINAEINFELLVKHATLQKVFKPLSKYPESYEDMSLIVGEDISTSDIISGIEQTNDLIKEVTLLDKYKNTRTFHITYHDPTKNLTSADISTIREEIVKTLQKKFNATFK